MEKATFYHAGCPVCVSAEQDLLGIVDSSRVFVEIVHLGEQRDRLEEAAQIGVRSVPALVLESGQVLHINHGATLAEVRS
jgi:glutaredoxin 3